MFSEDLATFLFPLPAAALARLQSDTAVAEIIHGQARPGGAALQIVFDPDAMSYDRLCRHLLEAGELGAICAHDASQRAAAERLLREFNDSGQRRRTRILDRVDFQAED